MNKDRFLVLLLVGIALVGGNCSNKYKNHGWTDDFKNSLIKPCVDQYNKEGKYNEKIAKELCTCLAEKLEKKYPSEDSLKVAFSKDKSIVKNLFKEEGLNCMTYVQRKYPNELFTQSREWNDKLRKISIENCIKGTLNKGMKNPQLSSLDIEKYCICIQEKIEIKYPNQTDYERLVINHYDSFVDSLAKESAECLKNNSK